MPSRGNCESLPEELKAAGNPKGWKTNGRIDAMTPLSLVARLALLCALLFGFALPAGAEVYPNKPIRLIVSIAAGSVTDVIMRAAANELHGSLGQPLVIENKGGASGI